MCCCYVGVVWGLVIVKYGIDDYGIFCLGIGDDESLSWGCIVKKVMNYGWIFEVVWLMCLVGCKSLDVWYVVLS